MISKINIILGCNGKTFVINKKSFKSCSGIENIILTITENMENLDWILSYLKALSIFERPMKDYNAIRNCLFKIQDNFFQKLQPIWSNEYFHIIEEFTLTHRNCGIYLKAIIE